MPITPLNDRERKRALECAKGMRQYELICNMLERDDVPEPIYGTPRRQRAYKISLHPSFDALLDRLEHRGFTVLIRDIPTRNNCGHDRFYSLRRTRDVNVYSPLGDASADLLVSVSRGRGSQVEAAGDARGRATA
jgi:hypothetical protein